MTIREETIAAFEGEICPKCGQRRILRVIGAVGTLEKRFVIGIGERVACSCPQDPQIAAPKDVSKNPLASSGDGA